MSTWVDKLKRAAKKNKMVKKAYDQAKSNFITTHVGEITPFNARRSENGNIRYNLLVPSINKEHVFGGISTAIKFFEELVPNGCDKRIIMTDASPSEEDLIPFKDYQLITSEQDSTNSYQIVAFNDRYQKTIPVRENDIFVATAWWTAYSAQRIVEWQEVEYNQARKKLVYFIQDYEPCFYPWSSQSILAESTYNYGGSQIAVFNTSLLRDFVISRGHNFSKTYTFEPQLNTILKNQLETSDLNEKKNIILLYGRPSVMRNAFTLIVEALRVWVWSYQDSKNWEVHSVGESHPDIEIGNGVVIKSHGKMLLEEYSKIMSESAVGISLMISPHPSYPPLEMAHFGMLVLTNNYENKDLSSFHPNINSIKSPTPSNMSLVLSDLCKQFSENRTIGVNVEPNKSYYNETKIFPFLSEILEEINK